MNLAVFFIIAGAAQLFYVVPMIRRWGRPWYYIGIMGTAILIIIWIGSRIPSGFSDPLPIDLRSILVQVFQFAFLLFTIRILQTLTRPFKDSARDAGYGAVAASQWLSTDECTVRSNVSGIALTAFIVAVAVSLTYYQFFYIPEASIRPLVPQEVLEPADVTKVLVAVGSSNPNNDRLFVPSNVCATLTWSSFFVTGPSMSDLWRSLSVYYFACPLTYCFS